MSEHLVVGEYDRIELVYHLASTDRAEDAINLADAWSAKLDSSVHGCKPHINTPNSQITRNSVARHKKFEISLQMTTGNMTLHVQENPQLLRQQKFKIKANSCASSFRRATAHAVAAIQWRH